MNITKQLPLPLVLSAHHTNVIFLQVHEKNKAGFTALKLAGFQNYIHPIRLYSKNLTLIITKLKLPENVTIVARCSLVLEGKSRSYDDEFFVIYIILIIIKFLFFYNKVSI